MKSNALIFLSRVAIGTLFFYAGITKVFDPTWSAEGYLKNAKTFNAFYTWLASPGMLPITNFVNEWGLTLLGLVFVLGIGIKYAAPLGALMMLLYYFPILDFPYAGEHAYIVDEHIIYALLLLLLWKLNAGRVWGIEGRFRPSR
jgi:thiosulfate dehydrogenase [quinone] large subunit